MSAEVKKEIELEIAHVLFVDIVGYSKLSVNEQHARVDELNGIVRLSEQYQKAEAANRILKIPTGDGMALVFYRSPEEPAQCAFEISRALKDNQRLQVRMGIHSGPVSGVVDVNERTNVAGAGINLAQRVMDCGDAGHILVSRHVVEDLAEYERWRPYLHDIGTLEVKHGVRVSVTNFYSDEVGNPNLPSTLHVANVLEGSVRKAGNSVRITAQLIKAGTDTHLWSQTYDRKLDDIFAIQDEIAADVVKQLKVTLLGETPKARTTDPEAYALYLQAVQLGRQFTAE